MEEVNSSSATPPSHASSVRPSVISIASEELYRGRIPLVETERYRKSRKSTLIQSPSSSENSVVPWVNLGNQNIPSEQTSQFSRSMITVNSSAGNSGNNTEQTSQFSRSMITVGSSPNTREIAGTFSFSRSLITVNSDQTVGSSPVSPVPQEDSVGAGIEGLTTQISRTVSGDSSSHKSGRSHPSKSSRNSNNEKLRLEARLRVARAAAAAAAAQLEIAQAEERLLSIMESDSEMEMTPREQLTTTVNPVEAGRNPVTHNSTSVAALVARFEERAVTTGSPAGRQPAASSSSSSHIIVPITNLLTQIPSVDLLGIDNERRGNPEMFSIASPPPTPIAVVPPEQPDPSSVTDIVVAQDGLVVKGLTPSILETGTQLGHPTPVRSVNRFLDTEERRAVIVSDNRPTALQRGMLYAEVCPYEPLDPTSPSPRGAEFHTPDGQDSIINDLLGGVSIW